jgi:hypothetical protein
MPTAKFCPDAVNFMDLTPNCAATSAALFRVFGDNRVKQPVTDDLSAPV